MAWTLDDNQHETVQFRGYEGRTKPSDVSGQPRLYYDRAAPFTRPVKHFNTYKATVTARRPTAYLIPQAWGEVVEILRRNGATLEPLSHAVTTPVEVYYVQDFKTTPRPFEGHFVAELLDVGQRHGARDVGRPHRAGYHAVHPNVALAQVGGQAFGEGVNGRFGSRVVNQGTGLT